MWSFFSCNQSTAVCPTSTAVPMAAASAASGSVTATTTAGTWAMNKSVVRSQPHHSKSVPIKPFAHLLYYVFVLWPLSATTTCDPSNQLRCVSSGSCIPLAFKCDHEDDCGDNSDEEHCGKMCCCVLSPCIAICLPTFSANETGWTLKIKNN